MQELDIFSPTQIVTGMAGIGLIFKAMVDHIHGRVTNKGKECEHMEIILLLSEMNSTLKRIEASKK